MQIFCRDNEYLPPKTLWPCSWRHPTARRWYCAGSECLVFTDLQHKNESKGLDVKVNQKTKNEHKQQHFEQSAHNCQAPSCHRRKKEGAGWHQVEGIGKAIQPSHLWLNQTAQPQELEVTTELLQPFKPQPLSQQNNPALSSHH